MHVCVLVCVRTCFCACVCVHLMKVIERYIFILDLLSLVQVFCVLFRVCGREEQVLVFFFSCRSNVY